MTHTPGKWKFCRETAYPSSNVSWIMSDKRYVIIHRGSHRVSDEDGALLAAAPDLLAACKAAMKRFGIHSCGEVKQLGDAVARAEGEKP